MKSKSEETVDIYKRVIAIVFDRLSPTFGQRTIGAIAKNVLARQSKKHKALAYLSVSERGIEWQQLQGHLGEITYRELSSSLESFLDEFFEALSSLIGELIMAKVFKEAEEGARQGGEQ